MSFEKLKRTFFEFTPLGKADKEVRDFLKENAPEKEFKAYESSLKQYRYFKIMQSSFKVLFYASLITAIAATFGLERELRLVQQVASYLGTTIIFILFAATSYFTMIKRESYHVRREILISRSDTKFRHD